MHLVWKAAAGDDLYFYSSSLDFDSYHKMIWTIDKSPFVTVMQCSGLAQKRWHLEKFLLPWPSGCKSRGIYPICFYSTKLYTSGPRSFQQIKAQYESGSPDLTQKNFLSPTIQRVGQVLNLRLTAILKKFCDTISWQFVNLLWFLDDWSLLHLSSPFIAALDGCLNGQLVLLVICVVENLVGWPVACIIGWFRQ